MTIDNKGKLALKTKCLPFIMAMLLVAVLAACGGNGADDYADSNGYDNDNGSATADATPSPTPAATPQATPEPTPEPEPEEIPFLWLVTAPHGQTMYVFGTTHIGLAEWFPLPQGLMDAFRRSDFIATEMPFHEVPHWTLPEGAEYVDINDHITPEQAEDFRLAALANLANYESYLNELMGLALDDVYDHDFEALIGIITMLASNKSGASGWYGMEIFFTREASSRSIPVLIIEDIDANMLAVLNASPQLQIAGFEAILNTSISELAAFERGQLEAWRSGDDQALLAALEAQFYRNTGGDADLIQETRDIGLTYRDPQMADRASEWMAEGKKVFFMVGAGHLVGEGNVLEILAERGYQIERIRQ